MIQKLRKSPKVYPTFRPDKAFAVEDAASYNDYLKKLESVVNSSIDSYDELCSALEQRIDFFHEHGGRLADHGLEQLYYFDTTAHNCNTIFTKIKGGQTLANEEVAFFKARTLLFLSREYHKRGWAQQFHRSFAEQQQTIIDQRQFLTSKSFEPFFK
jgi:glucuronate isomerase